jgi:predicted 3-demethylubiquinone-9 3-methyltransferase (glyoxalase superfamily)
MMSHPLVLQLRFTRSEFQRALKNVTTEEAERRFEPINCISWIIGHMAWQEQLYWLTHAQGMTPAPEVNACANGQPASTPALDEMWAAWRLVTQTADAWLDSLDSAQLETHTLKRIKPYEPYKESIGTRLRRTTYHPSSVILAVKRPTFLKQEVKSVNNGGKMNNGTQKITPYLWFHNQAEEAMNFYTSLFSDARIVEINRYPGGYEEGPLAGMEGKVIHGLFELAGYQFMALDGGPLFNFTPAISFFVNCEAEAEVDGLWNALAAGGEALMPLQAYPFSPRFGWIQDRYGLSWQLNMGESDAKITPFLLFVGPQHGRAEAAINDYTALFENSGIDRLMRYEAGEPGGVAGAIKHAAFTLNGQSFLAMDSGLEHAFTFNEAVSLYVNCDTQEEVDYLWQALSADPEAEQCGWLKDRYGVSWQIIPAILGELMNDPDPEKSRRVTDAMLQMKKIEIEGLKEAYERS